MKKIHITFALLLYSVLSFSQDISGKWNGTVKLGEDKEISFIFNIENIQNEYVTHLSIPSQRVAGLKPQNTSFKDGVLFIDGANLGIKYEGTFYENDQQFKGNFT